MQNCELTNFQLTLLVKRSLFLKEAKGSRRKENSKVIEVIEKVTRGPMLSLMLRSKQNKSFAIIARNHNIKDLNVILFRDLVRINLKVFRNLIFKEINTTIIKLGFWWANSRVIAHTSNIYLAEV